MAGKVGIEEGEGKGGREEGLCSVGEGMTCTLSLLLQVVCVFK